MSPLTGSASEMKEEPAVSGNTKLWTQQAWQDKLCTWACLKHRKNRRELSEQKEGVTLLATACTTISSEPKDA